MLPVVRARVEGALNGFVEVWFRVWLACSGPVHMKAKTGFWFSHLLFALAPWWAK